MKKRTVQALTLIVFIGFGLLINVPHFPTIQAWGMATHMWITDMVIAEMPTGDWKDAFEFFASDIKSGAITPDAVWQDWDNHLYYPQTGQYTAHIAVERWFGYMVNNLSIGAWKEGMFAAGIMLHYFADINIPIHTDSTWPGHGVCEGDINDHLNLFSGYNLSSIEVVSDPRQYTIDAATAANSFYDDCVAQYPNEIMPSPSPLTTNSTYFNIILLQLNRTLSGIRNLWFTAIQGLEAPDIPPGAISFTILIDGGHDNYYVDTQLTNFKSSLAQWGLNVIVDEDGIIPSDLLGVDLLVITAPYINFTLAETNAIADWFVNGTRTNMLVTGYSDFQNQYGFKRPTLNYLLANITTHIRLNDDQIFNPDGYQLWYCDINETLPGSLTFNITNNVDEIRMYSTSSLWYTDPLAITNITFGNPNFYQVDAYSPPVTVIYDNVDDGVGGDRIPLMAVEEVGDSRIMVSGTTFFSDYDYPVADNEILIENVCEWLLNASLLELDVFGPTITTVTRTPTPSLGGEAITISATISDPAGVDNATLYYQIDGGSEQQLTMTLAAQYSAQIPANQVTSGSVISYYIKTYDLLENWRKTLPTTFTVSANPPSTPILTDPGDTSTTGNFSVSWSTSTDVDGTVTHYQLQMSTSPGFSSILQEWNSTSTSQGLTELTNATYYFRVRAIDNEESPSNWSNIESITVAIPPSTTPPPTPPPINWILVGAIASGVGIAVVVIGLVYFFFIRKRE